ncbi:acyltransferase family protein [Saccharothrix yanglingensis]|uniref:acyltransferase family protein n=1 Tax=Saccharothrix yanglingensis TaxID=659496 RepID=UPI0027D2931F|nr:acyltransferase family protein [Saccharothrix yanglingensis]
MTGRDPRVDATRALAVVGVVLGHWLVTALVLTDDGLVVDSPLRWVPELAPACWVLQVLGLFFFTGGFGAARSTTPWWSRARRLLPPVAGPLAVRAVVLFGLSVRGLPQGTVWNTGYAVVTPLWFPGVYVLLLAATPLMARLGWWGVALPVALVAVDAWWAGPGWVNVLAVWWAPWQVGVLVARHGWRRSWGAALLGTGAVAFAALLGPGHPASAVGVPGAAESNLSPPSAAALALALARVGLVLPVRPAFRAPAHRRRRRSSCCTRARCSWSRSSALRSARCVACTRRRRTRYGCWSA